MKRRLGRALWPFAAVYLVSIWADGAGSSVPSTDLPGTVSFFLTIAGLFPNATKATIEYRLEGWACKDKRWEEIDYRVYFPLHADDLENRFYRILHYYRKDPDAMEALDDWIVNQHNAGKHFDAVTQGEAIGGVRFVSVRVPVPRPGTPPERYRHKSLPEYPRSYRHTVYRTEKEYIDQRCGETDAPEQEKIEADKPDLFDRGKSGY
jgi:hypothetical protein